MSSYQTDELTSEQNERLNRILEKKNQRYKGFNYPSPVSMNTIQKFERENGIRLPIELSKYLTTVSSHFCHKYAGLVSIDLKMIRCPNIAIYKEKLDELDRNRKYDYTGEGQYWYDIRLKALERIVPKEQCLRIKTHQRYTDLMSLSYMKGSVWNEGFADNGGMVDIAETFFEYIENSLENYRPPESCCCCSIL